MARTEVRKECPNCGLGVPLDAKVCEFCGWDFEDEDEWMGEINKLEDELVTDKQRFDDSSVDKMIKSTLRKPDEERMDVDFSPQTEAVTALAAVEKKRKATEPSPPERKRAPESGMTSKEPMPAPSPAVSKQKTFRIDITKVQAPKPETEPKPVKTAPATPTKPVSAEVQPASTPAPTVPTAPAKQEKVVRRVVTYGGQKKEQPEGGSAKAPPANKPQAENKIAPAREADERAEPAKHSFFGHHGKKKEEEAHVAQKGARPVVKVFVCPLCNKEVKETESKCPGCGAEFE